MRFLSTSAVRRYGLAVASIALAAALHVAVEPLFDRVPFLTLFLAVLAIAWYGGLGPGLLATALGIFVTTAGPLLGWIPGEPQSWTPALLRFGLAGVVASLLLARLHRGSLQLRGERELRASELGKVNRELERRVEELQTLLEAAPIAIWVAHDPACSVVTGNHVARAMLGGEDAAAPGAHAAMAPLPPRGLRVLEDGRELQPEDRPLHRAASTGAPVRGLDLEVIDEEQRRRHLTVNAVPLRDERGRVRGAIAVALDVTERRRADQATAELAAIVASSDDAILAKTLDGVITSWNAGAERLYRYRAEEAVGRSITMIVPPERREEVADLLARLARGERIEHLETVRLRKDGSRIQVSATISPIVDAAGRVTGASVIARDVGERRRTEVALRFLAEASESLTKLVDYRSMLETVARLAVPDFADWCAVDMLAADGSIERLAVAHVDPSKVRLAEELYRRYPPDPDATYGVPQVLRTGVSERVGEITDAMIHATVPDEERRAILEQLGLRSYMCVPLRAQDRIFGVLSFVAAESGRRYDATDLVAAEDLARRAAVALDNARLYQELRESDRRKDEFLAVLSHELRNPLAPIRSGLEMMAMDGGQRHPTIDLMREQVVHLIRLVDDLLDVSRITRGRVELRQEPVELETVLERAAAAMRTTLEPRRQTLAISLPPASMVLDADPVRLLQILENLLQNASKFSDAGAAIELSAERAGEEAVIRVRDPGIGIDATLLPQLFQPFMQATRALDRTQGGLGIGLALVRGLVERHGGSVTASSAGPGEGSEFVVRLPLSRRPKAGDRRRETTPARANGSRRILVVDDNVAAAQMLSLLLSRLGGHQVEIAHDGPTAVESVRARHPEIVLLDIGLPKMDGYEVGRTIRRDPTFDDVLVVALTGYGQEEDRRRSREAGFDEHLVKPPALEDLERLFVHPKLKKQVEEAE